MCLKDASNIWTVSIPKHDLTPQRVHAIVLTYDILNDDDEEIREVGSHIASKIMSTASKYSQVCVPLVASQQLLAHLVKKYRQSEHLLQHAIQKMTQSILRNDILLPSAQDRFKSANAENTALFVVEKQNLFIDQYREAVLWSQVLKRLSAKAISDAAASALSGWVRDGLTLLSDKAHYELDGPLGWTSKAEVYVFGMQVLYATDVMLNWRARTKKGQVEGKVIRELLATLYSRGTRTQVHGAWLEKIEKMLAEDMGRRAMGLGRILQSIVDVQSLPEGGWTVEDV